MTALLEKLLDLPREMRLATTWLVLATLAVFADAYAISRFDRSLLFLLKQSDELLAMPYRMGFLLPEGFYALSAVVIAWFFVLPTVTLVWQQVLFEIRIRLPFRRNRERAYPLSSDGWLWTGFARIRAIEEDNTLLYQACEARIAEDKSKDLQMRCILASVLVSLWAFIQSTPQSGPCLVQAFLAWANGLSSGHQTLLLLLGVPAIWMMLAVLAGEGREFDGYIRLSAPSSTKRLPG